MILNWGIQKANEMQVEMWLGSSAYGVHLYKKHGFHMVSEKFRDYKKEDASPDWIDLERRIGTRTERIMWRPIGGPYVEGKTVKPWEKESSKE